MKSVNEILEKLPFSRGFLLVLVGIALIVYKINKPFVEGRAELTNWHNTLDERETRVAESIDSLRVPDEKLLNCIRIAATERAKIHPMNTGGIDDVRELQLLYCPGSNITDLSGIDELSSLTYIDLSKNGIHSLTPLQNHPKLKSLHVADNPLDDLYALKSLKSLKELYLPDMPEQPCLRVSDLVRGIKSNYSSIKCAGPRNREAEVNISLESIKRNKPSPGDGSNELTSAQKQELFEYEREMRYQK